MSELFWDVGKGTVLVVQSPMKIYAAEVIRKGPEFIFCKVYGLQNKVNFYRDSGLPKNPQLKLVLRHPKEEEADLVGLQQARIFMRQADFDSLPAEIVLSVYNQIKADIRRNVLFRKNRFI